MGSLPNRSRDVSSLKVDPGSISPTFDTNTNLSRNYKKLPERLLYKKAACKMLVKSTRMITSVIPVILHRSYRHFLHFVRFSTVTTHFCSFLHWKIGHRVFCLKNKLCIDKWNHQLVFCILVCKQTTRSRLKGRRVEHCSIQFFC